MSILTPTTEAASSHPCWVHLSSTAVTRNKLRPQLFILFVSLFKQIEASPQQRCVLLPLHLFFRKAFGNAAHELSICPPKTLRRI